ncbi:MAG: hypothetical protein M3340_07045 [Actinomycetota bacterium]|nr:hypothetical protein [Actinomycetota bacterium]
MAGVLALAWATPAEAAPRCSGKGARGLASTSSARVFTLPAGGDEKVYACLFSQNKRRRLGTLRNCGDDLATSQFTLRGRYVGYVETSCGLASGTDWVVVRDIRTGGVRYRAFGAANAEAPSGTEPSITVHELEMSRSGSVVWIGDYDHDSDGVGGANDRRQVRMMFNGYAQANGDVADEGLGITVGSLALGPQNQQGFSWAYWQVGDQPRTAKLQR